MIRVVLDTNILISALLTPEGPPSLTLRMTLFRADLQLCVTGQIFNEYADVIRRPRFQRSDQEIQELLAAIRAEAFWLRSSVSVHACTDPDDNIFLECAQAAEADYLVTGNLWHFPDQWLTTRIVSPRDFLHLVA